MLASMTPIFFPKLKFSIFRVEVRSLDASINNRIQEIEERISGAEDTIENIDSKVKENANCKKTVTQNIQEIQDIMRRPNLRIIGID